MICKKIGVDFHGVINSNPLFFEQFCNLALKLGYEIYVISGGPREMIKEFMERHNIGYISVWCIYDYFEAKNEVEFLPDGSFHVEDEAWNRAKGAYCRQNDISIQIDDSPIYGKYFTTPYCKYYERTKQGLLNGVNIDFSASAADCLQKIITLLKKYY